MHSCKIIVKDQVNIKIENLDLSTRRRLVQKFEYDVPGARYLPAVRLGRWNGKVSFFQLGGSTYLNLLPEILDILVEEGYDIDVEDERHQQPAFTFTQVDEDTFADSVWPTGHPMAGQPVVLRDYQMDILNTFLENPQCIQEVATGAGKTIMTAALSRFVEPYGRSIVIVPNKSLVTQTEADYKNLGLNVGVYYGDRKELGKTHTICTWQSLNNIIKDYKSGKSSMSLEEFADDVVCIMVDEAHSAKADALKSLLTQSFAHVPIRWGLTGTIPKEKFESQALLVGIGPLKGQLTASELQDKGVLAQCHVNIVQLQDKVEFTNYQSELKHLLEDSKRMDMVSTLIQNIRQTGNTLVLVDRLSAGSAICERIEDAVFISGNTKATARKDEYDSVSVTDNRVLVATYGVAAVGINVPRIFNVVLIEPGKSFVRVIQSIGRGIRKAEDKDYVDIWDITSSCKFSKRHLTKRKAFYKDANYPFSQEKLDYK